MSEVLGHASLAITKDVYGHLMGREKRAATESITGVLFGTVDSGSNADEQQSHA